MINIDKNENKIKLIIGASSQNYKGWIQTQRSNLDLTNRTDWENSFGTKKINNTETKLVSRILYPRKLATLCGIGSFYSVTTCRKPNRHVYNILAEHVWEHLDEIEALKSAQILYDFLDKDGLIRIAVPDLYFQNEWYQNIVKVGGPGPKDHPAASHKILYNYKTITKAFVSVGFKVNLLEYCDENGIFHYNEWDKMKASYTDLKDLIIEIKMKN